VLGGAACLIRLLVLVDDVLSLVFFAFEFCIVESASVQNINKFTSNSYYCYTFTNIIIITTGRSRFGRTGCPLPTIDQKCNGWSRLQKAVCL